MPKTIIVSSFSKLNLFLEVESLRKDYFHNIFSYVIPLDYADQIIITEHYDGAKKIIFESNDEFLRNHNLEDLTLGKAIKILEPYKKNDRMFHLYLHKKVPYGAGLGIASSNAATLMKVLNGFWECSFSIEELQKFSVEIGADCPLFFEDSIMQCEGKGEKITRIGKKPLKFPLVVFMPKEIKVNTKESYDWVKKERAYSLNQEQRLAFKDFFQTWNPKVLLNNRTNNTFETLLTKQHPLYDQLKTILVDHSFCYSLTGSGSAYYALFQDKSTVERFFFQNQNFLKNFFDLYQTLL